MMTQRFLLGAAALVLLSAPLAARPMSDKARMRAEAEHACYADVQSLCSDSIPDEAKITLCMKAKRAQLSAPCRKVFDRGMGT